MRRLLKKACISLTKTSRVNFGAQAYDRKPVPVCVALGRKNESASPLVKILPPTRNEIFADALLQKSVFISAILLNRSSHPLRKDEPPCSRMNDKMVRRRKGKPLFGTGDCCDGKKMVVDNLR